MFTVIMNHYPQNMKEKCWAGHDIYVGKIDNIHKWCYVAWFKSVFSGWPLLSDCDIDFASMVTSGDPTWPFSSSKLSHASNKPPFNYSDRKKNSNFHNIDTYNNQYINYILNNIHYREIIKIATTVTVTVSFFNWM